MASAPYSPFYKRLREAVERESGKTLNQDPNLMKTWYLSSYEYSEDEFDNCACGKKNIKHLYYMRTKALREDGPQLLVGSECVNQFDAPKAIELMNLLEKGISVEFMGCEDNNLIFKVFSENRKNYIKKLFPKIFNENEFLSVPDSERVVQHDDQVEQTVGQLFLKSWEPDEDPVEIFIWKFIKKRMKSKNTIIIDGKAWTMKPTSSILSKYVNQCPFCRENFVVKKTMIIPCERRHETKWICSKHSNTTPNKEDWSQPTKQGQWQFIEHLMYGVWIWD